MCVCLCCLYCQTEFPFSFTLIVVSENMPLWQSSLFFLLLFFVLSFVMLFISCRCTRSLGIIVSCTIDYMSCSVNRDYRPPLPWVCTFVCLHAHIRAGVGLVIFLPCRDTALLCFWFLLLFGSIFFLFLRITWSPPMILTMLPQGLITGKKSVLKNVNSLHQYSEVSVTILFLSLLLSFSPTTHTKCFMSATFFRSVIPNVGSGLLKVVSRQIVRVAKCNRAQGSRLVYYMYKHPFFPKGIPETICGRPKHIFYCTVRRQDIHSLVSVLQSRLCSNLCF